MKQHYDIWVVAAAVLKHHHEHDGSILHLEYLVKEIRNSGLSTLGLKGATPKQTLAPILRSGTRRHHFVETISQYFQLKSPESIHYYGKVAAALAAYRRHLEHDAKAESEYTDLLKLREENARLR